MATAKDALSAIETHEKECKLIYKSIDARLEEQGVHFKSILEELKAMQSKLRGEDIKRDIKNILFDDIQSRYDLIKLRRNEVMGGVNNSRIDGLNLALARMQKTLDMDKKDLDYNTKKLDHVNNKLELQLREAKIKVLKDRIASKEEKLADIQKTLQKLTKRSNSNEKPAPPEVIPATQDIVKSIEEPKVIDDEVADLSTEFDSTDTTEQ